MFSRFLIGGRDHAHTPSSLWVDLVISTTWGRVTFQRRRGCCAPWPWSFHWGRPRHLGQHSVPNEIPGLVKYARQLGLLSPTYGKIIQMFQTTNQWNHIYPLVNKHNSLLLKMAHLVRWFTHEKLWFSIVYQRVCCFFQVWINAPHASRNPHTRALLSIGSVHFWAPQGVFWIFKGWDLYILTRLISQRML